MELSISVVAVLALLGCYAANFRSFFTDILGQPVGPSLNVKQSKNFLDCLTVEFGPIGCL
jgi:hypothetical protein